MKQLYLPFCCLASAAISHAQCSETILINTGQLNGGQQQVYQFQLDDIANAEDTLLTMNWGTNGGTVGPLTLFLASTLPKAGVFLYDYANQNIAGCISEGPAFPPSWNGEEGEYSQHPSTPEQVSIKSRKRAEWNWDLTFTAINTWNPNYWASYNMTLTLSVLVPLNATTPSRATTFQTQSTLTTMFVNMPSISSGPISIAMETASMMKMET